MSSPHPSPLPEGEGAGAPEGPLRVLLADDHEPFRRAMRGVIDSQEDMHIVAEAADGAEAVRVSRSLRPDGLDVVLMDIDMPRLDGIKATQQITAADPDLPVVMLTVSTLDRDLFEAVQVGAIGFLSKGLSADAVVRALRSFHRYESLPLPRAMASKVLAYFQQRQDSSQTARAIAGGGLSSREMEVLELIARGARDREIATILVVSEGTVKKHVQNILRKLHARNRAEAVARLRPSS
jgi:DNA-binding NarL/FixJ family response regulator